MLNEQHLSDLKKSGLTEHTIRRAGYMSSAKGWEIDIRNPYTGEFKYKIIKLDDAKGQGKYRQPEGTKPHPYFSKLIENWDEILDNPKEPLILTEGTKKADCAIQNGFNTVSFQGTYGWSHKGKPISEMKWIFKPGRGVFVCFDSDQLENEHVARAIQDLAKVGYRAGSSIKLIQLPRDTKGIDDFFVKHGDKAKAMFQELINNAVDPLEGLFFSPEEIREKIHTNKNKPTMNFNMLPEKLQEFHHWSKDSTHAPDEIIVGMMIGTLATALGKQVAIKSPGGKHLFPNLWLCGMAASGRGKTTAANIGFDFINEINNHQVNVYLEEMKEYDRLILQYKESDGEGAEEPVRPKVRRPVLPLLTSKEKLHETLAYSDGSGSMIAAEELSSLIVDINSPRNEGMKQFLMTLQGGSKAAISMDYKNSQTLPPIDRPALGILGVSTLGSFFKKFDLNDFSSGFLQRFNLIVGSSNKPKKAFPPERNPIKGAEFQGLVNSLFAFDTVYGELEQTKLLELSPEAKQHWESTFTSLDREFGTMQNDDVISCFDRYNNETTFKIATVFHCLIEPGKDQVSKKTLMQAIELVEFFKSSLLFVLEEIGAKDLRSMASKIITKLENQGKELTHKKLKDKCNGHKQSIFDEALDWLLDLGIVEIKEIENSSNNGAPSKIVYLMLERNQEGY